MRCTERRTRRGFSLMELMIVVVITGVLAAIAIPTFSGYVIKSRTSEAVQFLGVIKLKQEAYRAEFGQYWQYDGNTVPANIVYIPGNVDIMDGDEAQFPNDNDAFNILGAKPDGPVRFGYGWAAGLPGDAAGAGIDADPYGMQDPLDHYFVAQAVADLDNDVGEPDGASCTFEVTSFTKGVWFSPAKGWE
jgi:prepilin-type N-terminal cleavage/methylation domain-containing protein